VAGVVEASAVRDARRTRPWLPRYLRVLGVLRAMRERLPGDVEVSGFGRRFSRGLAPVPLEASDAPVLLRSGDEHLVCDPVSRRVLRTGADAARILEVALANRAGDTVQDVASHLALGTPTARAAVAELQGTLDRSGFPLTLAASS
jgi:hypothetical protein